MNARVAGHADAAVPPRRGAGPDGRGPRSSSTATERIIEDVPYLADPAGIRLLPGAAEALVRLGAPASPGCW